MKYFNKTKDQAKTKSNRIVSIHNIKLNHTNYSFQLIRKEIKHTYIRMQPSGLIVTTNHHTSLTQIYALLEKHELKIIQKLNHFEASISTVELASNECYYLGSVYKVRTEVLYSDDFVIRDHEIIFNVDRQFNHKTLNHFFRTQAQKVFSERLAILYKQFIPYHVKKPTLKIRKMKSRYGTCYYNDHKIILNLDLIHCQISHIDYVIAHELCHFLYHDHGKGFKTLLSIIVPDWRDKKIELNKHFRRLSTQL